MSEKGNYEQWVKFFLQAIDESALDSISSIRQLVALHAKNAEKIASQKNSHKTINKIFEYIESKPIIEIGKTSSELGLSYNTVSQAIEKLVNLGILKKITDARRNRRFAYDEYLQILRKDT